MMIPMTWALNEATTSMNQRSRLMKSGKRESFALRYSQKQDGELRSRRVGNIPIDLNCYRQDLALLGKSRSLCDLYGNNWEGLAQEESGFCGADERLPWWERKLDLLATYRFNLAFENTNWPYYVTEKIWQSIKAGCLPVYWGQGNSIYETFETGQLCRCLLIHQQGFFVGLSLRNGFQRMERADGPLCKMLQRRHVRTSGVRVSPL